MALSFHTEGRGETVLKNDKSLISTNTFNTEIYTYTASLNSSLVRVGKLSNLAGATAANCPAGRVLHLTGKRLIPGVNPMNTFPASGPLASQKSPGKYLISIYDPVTGFRGYIDPTSTTFANFDQNLPNFYDQGTSGALLPLLGGKGAKLSLSSFPMTAVTLFSTTSAATNTAVVAAGNASVGMLMPVAFATPYSVTYNVGGSIRVNTTAATANSAIFVSLCDNAADLMAQPSDGYITIYIGVIRAFGAAGAAIQNGVCVAFMIVN